MVARRGTCLMLAGWMLIQPSVAVLAQERRPREEEAPVGIVVVVGGVGGIDILGLSAHIALPLAGLKHEVRDFVWTHGRGQILKDLQDTRHLEAKARELARMIRRLQAEFPGRPIYLVAKSGGTGLALRAAELLADDTLERIILLSAAVSPDYDLRQALRSTRREIVSFHSRYDQFILNWGTRQFGTIDRVYGPSAGLVGFRPPEEDADTLRLYRRVVQVPWSPRMLGAGHIGTHSGTSFPAFLHQEVTRWLR